MTDGNLSSALAKSRRLCVTMLQGLAATASSTTRLSPSSRRFGRHEKYTSIICVFAMKASNKALCSISLSGQRACVSGRDNTSSYSANNGVEITVRTWPVKIRRRTSRDAPLPHGECGHQNVAGDDNLIHVQMIALVLSFGGGKQRIAEFAPRCGSGTSAIAATTNHRGKTSPT